MANRTITIVDNASSKKVVINGDFTTFDEVLTAARKHGINTSGVDFMEGLTKTVFNRPDALLPTDVPYKGSNTNNLIFAVTKSNKNIKSGHDRNELKVIIQANNLGEAIKEMFGKNWTNCSNGELEQAISNLCNSFPADVLEESSCAEKENCFYTEEYNNFVVGVARLLASLNTETLEDILECVNEVEGNKTVNTCKQKAKVESPYSEDELEDILSELD